MIVHVHFIVFMSMETPKLVVFVVKRYPVREAKRWRYAVRKAKIGRDAVRKGGLSPSYKRFASTLDFGVRPLSHLHRAHDLHNRRTCACLSIECSSHRVVSPYLCSLEGTIWITATLSSCICDLFTSKYFLVPLK